MLSTALGKRRVLTEDAGRFAAEFERHWRQIFGGGLHDQPPDGCRSGIEQMVERQPRESLADLRSADDGCDLIGGKQTAQQLGQKIGRARRQLGRLQHDAIAGRERRDKRHDGKIERIIPRTDDADDADRLIENAGAGRHQFEPDRHPLRPHPAGKMAQRMCGSPLAPEIPRRARFRGANDCRNRPKSPPPGDRLCARSRRQAFSDRRAAPAADGAPARKKAARCASNIARMSAEMGR